MLKRLIKYGDIFGSPVKFFFENEDEHTTVLGGLVTIFINLVGLAYGAYMFIGWLDGRFLPTVQTT